MNRFKYEAFLLEFACLNEVLSNWVFIPPGSIDDIVVRRISPELLACDHSSFEWYALDEDGFVLMYMGPGYIRYNEFILSPDDQRAVTTEMPLSYKVGEALAEHPRPNDVTFLVRIGGHTDPEARMIVIYKPPKGFTIQGWITEQVQQQRLVIQNEIATTHAESEAT